jgi:hypothetical protein
MSKEYARIESAINWVVGKPVAAIVFGILIGSRWTIKRFVSLWNRVQCFVCTKQAGVERK